MIFFGGGEWDGVKSSFLGLSYHMTWCLRIFVFYLWRLQCDCSYMHVSAISCHDTWELSSTMDHLPLNLLQGHLFSYSTYTLSLIPASDCSRRCWFNGQKTEFYRRRVSGAGKRIFATVKSILTVANAKWEASYSHSNAISVFGLMYMPTCTSYFVEKRHFATLLLWRHNKNIPFRYNAHLTASNKGKLANQNAGYKIMASEYAGFEIDALLWWKSL